MCLYIFKLVFFFFFFSSRRRHTRLTCDWSSDVCSSDLPKYVNLEFTFGNNTMNFKWGNKEDPGDGRLMMSLHRGLLKIYRSEERRVGKECRYRWWRYH